MPPRRPSKSRSAASEPAEAPAASRPSRRLAASQKARARQSAASLSRPKKKPSRPALAAPQDGSPQASRECLPSPGPSSAFPAPACSAPRQINHDASHSSAAAEDSLSLPRGAASGAASLNAPADARLPEPRVPSASPPRCDGLRLRQYQEAIFRDRDSGLLVLHWSRQIGKSYTLAAWAVDRLLAQLRSHDTWLVTILSNSRENGSELMLKCAEVCHRLGVLVESAASDSDAPAEGAFLATDESLDLKFENMRMDLRIRCRVNGRNAMGRIKVLAANPRTARGFSGDLILDEFAFHEKSSAIWEAAEPILAANREYLCRIASTGNGKHNMFYRMSAGEGPGDGSPFISASEIKVSRLTRTEAWKMGVQVFDPNTRRSITPAQARAKALDKRAYDQNYECAFNDESMALLTHDLISAAERSPVLIDEQAWSAASLEKLASATSPLFVGNDIGRNRDLSVVTVLEKTGSACRVAAMLRMSGLRLPAQKEQLALVCRLPRFSGYEGDMTGLGLGLIEFLQEEFGPSLIRGVNFSSTEALSERMKAAGDARSTARVTELMATDLMEAFEDRAIEIPIDQELRDDLRKPEKITSPGGRVSIAATRDEAGHADHFWSLALALRASRESQGGIRSAGQVRLGKSRFIPRRIPREGMGAARAAIAQARPAWPLPAHRIAPPRWAASALAPLHYVASLLAHAETTRGELIPC